jgi:hypothetical protein
MLTWVFVGWVGRRTLILVGCAICTVCMIIMAAIYSATGLSVHNAGVGLIVVTSIYLFGFNFGLEPCKLFPSASRSLADRIC